MVLLPLCCVLVLGGVVWYCDGAVAMVLCCGIGVVLCGIVVLLLPWCCGVVL